MISYSTTDLPAYYKTSPDGFSRYHLIKEVVKTFFKEKRIEILDIGGKQNLLFSMLKHENLPYNLTVIDVLPPDESTKDYEYIQGDACKMTFEDNQFDAVVSADTLEHIPDDKKNDLVKEAIRVSKNLIVIAAPFYTEVVDHSDHMANNFFVSLTGEDHPWLKEHFEMNKPRKKDMEDLLSIYKSDLTYTSYSSNFLENWMNNMLLHLLQVQYPELNELIEDINAYYNSNLSELNDFRAPGYRQFYIMTEKYLDLTKVQPIFRSNYNPTKKLSYIKKMSTIIKKSMDLKQKVIQEKDSTIIEKDKYINDISNVIDIVKKEIKFKNTYIQNLHDKIETLNAHVKHQDHILYHKNKEMKLKDEELARLGNILNNITSAKVFQIWQRFNTVKKTILGKTDHTPEIIPKEQKLSEKPPEKDREGELDSPNKDPYELWVKKHYPSKTEINKQKKQYHTFSIQPKISIILPVYNPDPQYLKECLKSVLNQSYENWELCIADDASDDKEIVRIIERYAKKTDAIKYTIREVNGHICEASNSALELATGEYLAFLDHDDFLWPNALYEVVQAINDHNKPSLLYSDEDKLSDEGTHCNPFFKPDWSPNLLRTNNYITHFTVIQRRLITKVGGFRSTFEGAQDWDLFLRVTHEIQKKKKNATDHIIHIPKIIYSWREHSDSTATGNIIVKAYAIEAQQKALIEDSKRRNIKAEILPIKHHRQTIFWRTKYKIQNNPLVSIIIPTKDSYKYISKCLETVLQKSTYKNYELVIADTGSTSKKVWELYDNVQELHKDTRILKWEKPFNFASVCNFAVKKAKGSYILLLNNDTEIITPDWIEGLLEHAQRPEIGAVGCKLLYPDDTIQHGGVILGLTGNPKEKGVAGHSFGRLPNIPNNFLMNGVRNVSAVTAACLMVSKEKYLEVGGQDERFQIAFNDIDFNLKLMKKGYLNVYTGHVELYHHESVSVGDPSRPDENKRDLKLFAKEIQLMHDTWGDLLQNDPYYNPNLTLNNGDWSLKMV